MAKRVSGGAGGHDIPANFGGEQDPGTTPSTPSTPTTPRTHVTGSQYSGQAPSRWGRNFANAEQNARSNNQRVAANLELAHEGDDSALLPYRPTSTSNPRRPRTTAAGYDRVNNVLFVRFRDGAGYEYHDVSPSQWRSFRDSPSPGKYINAELNHHRYYPADW